MMTLIGIVLVLAGLLGLVVCSRAPRLVRSAGKPLAEPRIPFYLDAWQTVVFGAGGDMTLIRDRLTALFTAAHQQGFACRAERIWRWGLDGKTEREQMVLRYGRGMVFAQVHSYGSDLYVGWDAHMNLGTWKEKTIASGIDRDTGERVRVMTVERAVQPVTEYDLVDLNCLLEWTHAQVTQVLRQYLRERQINQEIDFTIIRGDRQSATRAAEKRDTGPDERSRRFRRTA
ncbi:MAG TPA: hypothetical protein VFR81_18675 [Longimicrobium sp.]|nr:hypothetical protein [Longimicrobium sp.]